MIKINQFFWHFVQMKLVFLHFKVNFEDKVLFLHKSKIMKCVICKNGETIQGKKIVTLERAGSIIVLKGVDASICNNCGEYYLDQKTTNEVL